MQRVIRFLSEKEDLERDRVLEKREKVKSEE